MLSERGPLELKLTLGGVRVRRESRAMASDCPENRQASTISPPGRVGLAFSLNLPRSNYRAAKRPSTVSRQRVSTGGEIDNTTGRTREDNDEEDERKPRGSRDPLNAHARPLSARQQQWRRTRRTCACRDALSEAATAEEIEEIVSSMGLWLFIRESISGNGKIHQKDDG